MSSSTESISHDKMETRDIFLTSEERFDVWSVKQEERPHLLNYSAPSSVSQVVSKNNDEDEEDDSLPQKYASACAADEHDIGDEEASLQSDTSSDGSLPLPLLDGCDIAGWRKEELVLPNSSVSASSSHQQGILNVGLGCTFLRNESQVSACLSNQIIRGSPWKQLQAKLLVEPPSVPGIASSAPSTSTITAGRTAAIRLSPIETEQLTGPYPWFEKENLPVILEGCTAKWKAMETCTWKALLEKYGDYYWRFSDTHGACMSLETYTKYTRSIEGLTDDAPLGVYDSQLHLDDRSHLLKDYQVPPCFDGMDLFQDVMVDKDDDDDESESNNEDGDDDDEMAEKNNQQPETQNYTEVKETVENQSDNEEEDSLEGDDSDNDSDSASSSGSLDGPSPPPYRWILMGPARSGTGLHIDPLGTHAWVTVVEGCKRWVLFPPTTDPASIGMQDPQIPSSIWFAQWYPRLQKEWETEFQGAVEVLQRPGETVYVPAGWPHLVLNLEDTVAITHNYASEYPHLSLLQEAVQEFEPELYQVWWPQLQECRPDLFASNTETPGPANCDISDILPELEEEKKED